MSNRLLALDNSLDFLNIALGENGELIEERHAKAANRSSEVLALRVSGLINDHGWSPHDLTHIVVTLGPGSFTGVRVGLAFCKGLAAGLGIPLAGIPTPDVLAIPFSFLEDTHVCTLIDAKKGEVFLALFKVSSRKIALVEGYYAVKPEALRHKVPRPCLCIGSGASLYRSVLEGLDGVTVVSEGFQRVTGEGLLRCGAQSPPQVAARQLKPIYGRKSEAEIKFGIDIA
jgi:tRNA threonylcarbamoyladenosine biosynthesis protein TsaB